MASMNFQEAVSMVTGAGGGMGRSIAQSLARRGGTVLVTDIELAAAKETADLITAEGGKAIARQVDVADAAAVAALADNIYSDYGHLDILVNNAGVTMRPFRAVWDASPKDFEWMMGINYFGVINGLLAFVPRMREQGTRGHIVNTSSLATLDDNPGHGMYTASKAAVDGISTVLRAELQEQGDDIGVTILYPGYVTTRIGTSERLRPEEDRSDNRQVKAYERRDTDKAHNRPLAPEFVGDMVVRAIELDLPCVLTHPAPTESLDQRVAAWKAGYLGILDPAAR